MSLREYWHLCNDVTPCLVGDTWTETVYDEVPEVVVGFHGNDELFVSNRVLDLLRRTDFLL